MPPGDRSPSARRASPHWFAVASHLFLPLAATLIGMLVISVPPATAEPVGSYLYFVPLGGYTAFPEHVRFSKLGSVSDEFYVGGRLGYQTTRWLGIEIAGGF